MWEKQIKFIGYFMGIWGIVFLSILVFASCEGKKEVEKLEVKQDVTFIGYAKPNENGEINTDFMEMSSIIMSDDSEQYTNVNKEEGEVAVYSLITKYKDLYIYDTGILEEIKKLKCERRNQLIREDSIILELNKPCK